MAAEVCRTVMVRRSRFTMLPSLVTDSIPLRNGCERVEVESVSKIFAEAIKRTFKHMSISSLFDVDKG